MLARRESRTPIPEWLRDAARDDDSDEEYEPEEEEQYDSDLDADKRTTTVSCVDECGFTAQQSCPPGWRSMTIGAAAWPRGSGYGRW